MCVHVPSITCATLLTCAHAYTQVIWKRFYKTDSSMDAGTLYQLRNLINRRNVISSPENDVNSCEEFLMIVIKAHVVAAAMEVMGMTDLNDQPNESIIPPGVTGSAVIESVAEVIISDYVDLDVTLDTPKQKSKRKATDKDIDRVQEYAKDVLSMGLLYLQFQESISDGAGKRVFIVWKFLLLIFRATGHTNYALEAFTLLCQYYYLFPPRQAEQLLTARFVNSSGGAGNNIPADLHMEHLNRVLKDCVKHLGANKTPRAIVRASKALQPLASVIKNFDSIHCVREEKGFHTRASEKKDLSMLVSQLTSSQVFANEPGRKHRSFPTFKCNVIHSVNQSKLNKWMHQKFSTLLSSSPLNR